MGGFLFKTFIGSRASGSNKRVEHWAATNQESGRISIANLYNASVDEEVAPSTKLVDEHNPCLYKKFIQKYYIRYHLSMQLKGKQHLANFPKIDISNT